MTKLRYRHTRLDNGIDIHTVSMPETAKVFYDARIRSGSIQEMSDKTGVAHYLEHMFGYGSNQYRERDVLPYLNSIGGDYNFGTGYFYTNYYAYCMARKIPDFTARISSILTDPAFSAVDVEQERGPILSETVQNWDMLKYNPHFQTQQKLFEGHRLGVPNIGLQRDIEKISEQDLRDYHQGLYVAPNFQIVAVGNVDHDNIVRRSELEYAALPSVPPKYKMTPIPFPAGIHAVPMDLQAVSLGIVFKLADAAPETRSLQRIAGSCLSDQLHEVIREQHKLAYSIHATGQRLPGQTSFGIYTNVQPHKVEKVLEEIFKSAADLVSTLSETHLKRYVAQVEENVADISTRPSEIGRSLAEMTMYEAYQPIDYDLTRARQMPVADIREALRSLFQGVSFVSYAGPAPDRLTGGDRVKDFRRRLGLPGLIS